MAHERLNPNGAELPTLTNQARLLGHDERGQDPPVLGADQWVDPPQQDLIFADGFESGTTSAWSVTVP